jgi:hypothetical protein
MNPREIELHIEELVLDGFEHGAKWNVGEGLEKELQKLLTENGLPSSWVSNPDHISTYTHALTNKGPAFADIARALIPERRAQ